MPPRRRRIPRPDLLTVLVLVVFIGFLLATVLPV
jgi:hypothetical protein